MRVCMHAYWNQGRIYVGICIERGRIGCEVSI